MSTVEPPETEEGYLVSHRMYRVHPGADREAYAEQMNGLASVLESYADQPRFDLVKLTGNEADFMTLYMDDELEELDKLERSIDTSPAAPYLSVAYGFLSVTELSHYRDLDAAVERELEAEDLEPGTEEYEEAREEKQNRMERYMKMRLYPELPDHPYVTFYPMEKRRNPDQNWYTLPHDERAKLMGQHGKTGRKFAGSIKQIITSSVGLDDWEWGVTLYGSDPREFKRLIYEMRFDEVSARYSDFGPFFTGYRVEPRQLVDRLT